MRLWSIHPKYLDSKGLVALWREGLLAQNVLAGNTKGYKNHPQLERFKNTGNPPGAIASYLRAVATEAESRGYHFDRRKIAGRNIRGKLRVTGGQLKYEFGHLLKKLETRDPRQFRSLKSTKKIAPHPLLSVVAGGVEPWEII